MSPDYEAEVRQPQFHPPGWLAPACVAAIVLGAAGLAAAFVVSPLDAWLWLLVCFLIFLGIATAMIGWAATLRVAQARWAACISRIAHSAIAFAPVSAAALVALVFGSWSYLEWIIHRVPKKEAWLNFPGFAIREFVGLAILWLLGFLLVRWSLVADARARETGKVPDSLMYRLNSVSVGYVAWYAIIETVVSWDFIMTLNPEWHSTMFGAYFFTTNLYLAMAVLVLLSAALRKPLGVEDKIKAQQFHDMGNLMLAFSLLSMGFFFAQYITIWYENLPHETFWLIRRYLKGPWPPIGWCSLILGYAIPFVLLQSRSLKQTPRLISPVAVMAVVGVSLERYVMVVPAFPQHYTNLMLFAPGVLALPGFLGAFVLTVAAFLGRYSPVSAADAALKRVPGMEEF